MSKEADHWGAYWRERQDGDRDALAQDAVHKDPGLQALWRRFFSEAAQTDPVLAGPILDIGCGDGGVLRWASSGVGGDMRKERAPLFGVDLAEQALAALTKDLPDASPVCARSERLPFANHSFVHVVSQYGVEYGGEAAFSEAARLIAPQGRFMAVAHYAGGSICGEAEAVLTELDALEAGAGFIAAAREFFAAIFAIERDGVDQRDGAPRFHKAQGAFQPLLAKAEEMGARDPKSLSARLVTTVKTLFQDRARYHEQDVYDWLAAMAAAMASSRARSSALLAAALNEEGAARALGLMEAGGLSPAPLRPLTLEGRAAPAAWLIAARRI